MLTKKVTDSIWRRLIGLESGSFLRGDYKITQRWAKVFLKALVERNSVMV